MPKNKYPFIPREYYAAVMYASKLVRETGCKNQAIERAARWFNVDADEVRKHLDARIKAGSKGKKKATTSGKKYKYYLVGEYIGSDASGEVLEVVSVVKALTSKNATARFSESDMRFDRANDYGGAYAPYKCHRVLFEYATKEEAETALKEFAEHMEMR